MRVVAILLMAVVAACGGDDDTGTPPSTAAEGATAPAESYIPGVTVADCADALVEANATLGGSAFDMSNVAAADICEKGPRSMFWDQAVDILRRAHELGLLEE